MASGDGQFALPWIDPLAHEDYRHRRGLGPFGLGEAESHEPFGRRSFVRGVNPLQALVFSEQVRHTPIPDFRGSPVSGVRAFTDVPAGTSP